MPPYTKPTSEAQRRKMFVLARQGKMSMADARGKSRAVKGRRLPRHVRARAAQPKRKSRSRRKATR